MSAPPPLVLDASVLIDYFDTEAEVLRLASRHLGQGLVLATTLEEIARGRPSGSRSPITREGCEALDLEFLLPTTDQLLEGATPSGGLSFEDRLCLIVARDLPGCCVTSDGPLRKACEAHGVAVQRGLRLMIDLHRAGHLTHKTALRIAREISQKNPYISAAVLTDFEAQL